ncbi:ion channel [Dyella caseinilytica]|uniref:Potassium channel protein n=1 Tax=Dyella caseinilytica TaxID=1849581 RepID=A0ABX7GRX2_9GAMM|nr:ion channel [Dyella caseinilytica]QRN52995.1 potassium channel protein [Dyella caseinilytica]GGA10646.1 inward rectifier potassium channel protein [Dyella caseinilytica]
MARKSPLIRRKPRIVQIGGRPFVSEGLPERMWDDFYHRALTVSWPVFFGLATSVFLTFNAIFAMIYQVDPHGIANQFPKGLAGAFFFSVETLATVGYGDMHPQSIYTHVVATSEIILGMGNIAVVTGLIFARFSRPQAKILFGKHPIVRTIEGKQTLMLRAANMRLNLIAQASAQLHLLRRYQSPEGFQLRRIEDLKLVRDHHPIFVLSWNVMHVIDEDSPLYGISHESLEDSEATLLLTIEGIDETTSQSMMARHQWSIKEVRWNHRYLDLVRRDENGLNVIDYTIFDDVLPIDEESQDAV